MNVRIIVTTLFNCQTEKKQWHTCPHWKRLLWANRKTYLVFHDPDLPEKIVNYDNDLQKRMEREEHEKHCHISQRTFLPTPHTVAGVNLVTKVSSDIQFWAMHNSWTYCEACNSLCSNILPHNFSNRAKNKKLKKCLCSQSRYVVPL